VTDMSPGFSRLTHRHCIEKDSEPHATEEGRAVRTRVRVIPILGMLLLLAMTGEIENADAITPYILIGLHEGHGQLTTGTTTIGYESDTIQDLPAEVAWQGKTNAIVNLFDDWVTDGATFRDPLPIFAQLLRVWQNGSVPMITWRPEVDLSGENLDQAISNGRFDAYIDAWTAQLRQWLAGPDGTYEAGNPTGSDDRRVYIRLAHEANHDHFAYNPCFNDPKPATVQNREGYFIDMWRHVHDEVMNSPAGPLDSSHVAWVFSVSSADQCPGVAKVAENIYPGNSYVDWVGVDGYNEPSCALPCYGASPSTIFGDMVGRLATIAPGKPWGITEWGMSTFGSTGDVGSRPPAVSTLDDKKTWINDLFTYANAAGSRMLLAWNFDAKFDYAVFSVTDWANQGDSTFTYTGLGQVPSTITYNAYSAYKSNVGTAVVTGSNSSSKRLLSDSQFLGQ